MEEIAFMKLAIGEIFEVFLLYVGYRTLRKISKKLGKDDDTGEEFEIKDDANCLVDTRGHRFYEK